MKKFYCPLCGEPIYKSNPQPGDKVRCPCAYWKRKSGYWQIYALTNRGRKEIAFLEAFVAWSNAAGVVCCHTDEEVSLLRAHRQKQQELELAVRGPAE